MRRDIMTVKKMDNGSERDVRVCWNIAVSVPRKLFSSLGFTWFLSVLFHRVHFFESSQVPNKINVLQYNWMVNSNLFIAPAIVKHSNDFRIFKVLASSETLCGCNLFMQEASKKISGFLFVLTTNMYCCCGHRNLE